MNIDQNLRQQLLAYQKNEITEHHIYTRLARTADSPANRALLEKIAADELRHYQEWRAHTQQEVKPDTLKIHAYYWISRILGFTFAIKLLERGEGDAEQHYAELQDFFEEAAAIAQDEHDHERTLINLLDEERLRYTGSIVLGINDALVELTGALAGFTLALQSTKLIALTGSITGVAASLSMAASEYLSTQTEETERDPLKASLYTGAAYLGTVLLLILPYLIFSNYYLCLACALGAAILVIAMFNYYVGVAKDLPFGKRFLQMVAISLGVAGLSFVIGFLIRAALGVEV